VCGLFFGVLYVCCVCGVCVCVCVCVWILVWAVSFFVFEMCVFCVGLCVLEGV